MSTAPEQNPYGVREFDLSTARTNRRIPVRAEQLTVLRAQDTADIRLGSPNAPPIPARDLGSIEIPEEIENIYLTNTSGTGVLRLLLGLQNVRSTAEQSGDDVDVTDRSARELGKARIEESGGTLIDPFNPDQVAQVSDSTSTATNYATVNLGETRTAVAIMADVSGSATLTIEVSTTGDFSGEEHAVETIDYSGASVNLEQYDFAYSDVRAKVDANLNELEIVTRGM